MSDYECIWHETNFDKKIFVTIFYHFGLGIDACSTITRCLSLPKRDDKKRQKRNFQPLHNDTKSVLSIKESYSMKKGPKFSQILMVRLGGDHPPPIHAKNEGSGDILPAHFLDVFGFSAKFRDFIRIFKKPSLPHHSLFGCMLESVTCISYKFRH